MATTTIGPGAARQCERSPRRSATVTRLVAATLTAIALLSMYGCGAGRNAQTSSEVPAIPGVDADAGPIGLRNLLIPFQEGGYPAGSDVPLVVRLFSNADQPVEVSQVAPGPAGSMTVAAQDIAVRQATGPGALTVPSNGELLLVPGSGPYLVAEHITAPLTDSASVPVRFTFSTGDSVDVDVPMAPPDYPVTGPQSQAGTG